MMPVSVATCRTDASAPRSPRRRGRGCRRRRSPPPKRRRAAPRAWRSARRDAPGPWRSAARSARRAPPCRGSRSRGAPAHCASAAWIVARTISPPKLTFRDDAVGAVLVEGGDGAPAPHRRRLAARAIGEDVSVAVLSRARRRRCRSRRRRDRRALQRRTDRPRRRRAARLLSGIVPGRAAVASMTLVGPQRVVDRLRRRRLRKSACAGVSGRCRQARRETAGDRFAALSRGLRKARAYCSGRCQRLQRDRIALVAEQAVGPMRLADRVEIDDRRAGRDSRHDLRQPREARPAPMSRGFCEASLRNTVAYSRPRIFSTRSLSSRPPTAMREPFVSSKKPSCRAPSSSRRESKAHHGGQRIQRDRRARGVGVEAQDRVARSRRLDARAR